MPGGRRLVASLVALRCRLVSGRICAGAKQRQATAWKRVRRGVVWLKSSWRKLDTVEAIRTVLGACRQRCSKQIPYAVESVGCGGGRVVRERELEHQGWAVVDLGSRRFPVQASSGEGGSDHVNCGRCAVCRLGACRRRGGRGRGLWRGRFCRRSK